MKKNTTCRNTVLVALTFMCLNLTTIKAQMNCSSGPYVIENKTAYTIIVHWEVDNINCTPIVCWPGGGGSALSPGQKLTIPCCDRDIFVHPTDYYDTTTLSWLPFFAAHSNAVHGTSTSCAPTSNVFDTGFIVSGVPYSST